MSYSSFLKALQLAPLRERYHVGKGIDSHVVLRAEKALGIEFSHQLKEYLEKYAYLEVMGCEFYGIVKTDFTAMPEGSIVESTLMLREEYGLPTEWIPILNYYDGRMAYLNFADVNDETEPQVIEAIFSRGRYEITEKVAEDLGDFLLQIVKQQ